MIHVQFVGSPGCVSCILCATIWRCCRRSTPYCCRKRAGWVKFPLVVRQECKAKPFYAMFIRSFRLLNRIWARPKLWEFSQYGISDMLRIFATYTEYFNYQSVEDHPSTFLHDDVLGATDSASSQRAARRWVFQLQIQGPMVLGSTNRRSKGCHAFEAFCFCFCGGALLYFFVGIATTQTCCCAPIFLRSEL